MNLSLPNTPATLCFSCVALVLGTVLLGGCGRDEATSKAALHSELFQTEPLQSQWNTVMAAMETNDYFVAVTQLQRLQLSDLAPEQLTAVNETLRALNTELIEGVDKGDSNASNAWYRLQQTSRSR